MSNDPTPRVDIALVHYPVLNRRGEVTGSALTNLDLHDLARACRTYGVATYWLLTPYREQQELAARIAAHWTDGYGAGANPDRRQALALVRIGHDLDSALAASAEKWGEHPLVVATSAGRRDRQVEYGWLRREIRQGRPVLLVFGTGWGLAPELSSRMDVFLAPIRGRDGYNHLSVRSAASIILDRLLAAEYA